MKYTINQFRKDYTDDDVCLDAIFKLRFSKMPCCPQCSQETTFKRIPGRRCYQCSDKDCQYQLYPTAGTVFEKTRTSLVDWFYVIYLMTSTRNGVASKEVQRQLGVTYKCALRMTHQIRKLMAENDKILSGIVEVDETYIGGKAKNKHKSYREKNNMNSKGANSVNKIGIMALLERNGHLITQVLQSNEESFKQHVLKHVGLGTTVVTDGSNSYTGLQGTFQHKIVQHTKDEWVIGKHHTNTVEGFFSHLKRMVRGTHIKVTKVHAKKYVDECVFRYIHRAEGQLMFFSILNQIAS